MAVTTLKGHVSRALDFYNKADKYFCIGRKTAWPVETAPPVPVSTDEMQEVVGYKKVESIFMVKPDDAGSLTYRGIKWKIVDPANAASEGARWVYISSFIAYSDLPTDISYRQVGLTTGLVKETGVPDGKYALLPAEVKTTGLLEEIDNRTPVYRDPDQREQLVLVIEF